MLGSGEGWGVVRDPRQPETDPPTYIRKICPRQNKMYQRGPKLEADFRYSLYLTAPPPPAPRPSKGSGVCHTAKGTYRGPVHVVFSCVRYLCQVGIVASAWALRTGM